MLNIALSRLVASLGHGDVVVIGDAGLPVPPGVELIDLALTHGVPDFLGTLKVLLSEMQVERHVLAEEILLKQPTPLPVLEAMAANGELGQRQLLSHEEFKVLSRKARAVIRTGSASRTAISP